MLLAAVVTILVCLPVAHAAIGGADAVFRFVDQRCAACHNAKLKSGDINLVETRAARTFDEDRDLWEKVAEKMATGQMPPPGTPRPPAEEISAITAWLRSEFARQDRAAKPDPGRVTARRLNRAEYDNTIRDLLGIDLRPASGFPTDSAAFGFDNIGDALNLPPALLENYIDAAERSVRTAIFGPPKLKPAAVHYSSPVRLNDARGQSKLPPNLFDYDLTGLSTLHSMHVLHRFPVEGEYNFRLVLNGHRPNQSEPVHPTFWIDGKQIRAFEVDATDLEGQVVEVRARVAAGEHLLSASYARNYHGLPPSYKGPEPSTRPEGALINPRGKLTEKDIETLRKLGTRIKTDGIETRVDNRYESLDIGGPFEQRTAPSAGSLRRIFVCGHAAGKHGASCARTIVTDFARRAFRRPVTAKEVQPYLAMTALAARHGDSFEEGIAAAIQAILVSPHFLYRIERDRPARPGQPGVSLTAHELASRLSYFLWSSMPDDALMDAATRGTLVQPAVLDAQVKRMLRDPKSRALVTDFAGQWLQFRNIDVVRPDPGRFPIFDDALRLSMRRETEEFIAHIIQSDSSVLDLIDADYTFLDERLARFYGIPGVTGPEFRKVAMPTSGRGGGILAHGSTLTISSYSTRTSPVLRGKWIMENLLNAPPPPPPAAVPALDDTKAGTAGTLRAQMEAHRKNPACASCHSRMDPLGFGLENFDAIGAWRTEDGKFPLDTSGSLPDGRTFESPAGLKKILRLEKDAFARGLTEKLMIYALGRGLERYDKPVVASIAARLPASNYRFSELALGIARSLPFRNRRAAAPLTSANANQGINP